MTCLAALMWPFPGLDWWLARRLTTGAKSGLVPWEIHSKDPTRVLIWELSLFGVVLDGVGIESILWPDLYGDSAGVAS